MRVFWKLAALSILALVATGCTGEGTETTDTSAVTLPGEESTEQATTAPAETSEAAAETTAAETVESSETGGDTEGTESDTSDSSETTAAETTEVETGGSETTEADTTSTSETTEATETSAAEGPASALGLKIVSINFDTSEVQVVNSGAAAVDISQYTWCNFPEYVGVSGGGVIEPGATATLTSTVQISSDSGELGLYRTSDFVDANAIAAYVEWGSADHERAPVAVAAGIWNGEPATVDGNTLTNG